VFSRPLFLLNETLTVRLTPRLDLGCDLFNLLDRRYDDITYYFDTRIRDPRPGGALESAAQPDYVTHPGEPRTVRVRLRVRL
jgi:TonB dependent receptor